MADRVYDARVSQLEEKVSYGILGILERIVLSNNDQPLNKCNTLLVNGHTMIRNCYKPGLSDKDILNSVAYDLEQLRHYFSLYITEPSVMIVYFNPGMNTLIPEYARKKETPSRTEIDRLANVIVTNENFVKNEVVVFDNSGKLRYGGLLVAGMFSYRSLMRVLASASNPRIWLISHCPIDYFLYDRFSKMAIMTSHTGKLLHRKDLPQKIFKDDEIPFDRMTYKLFGDKDFLRAIIRNRPKALLALKGINIKLKTSREIAMIAKNRLGVDLKTLEWDL